MHNFVFDTNIWISIFWGKKAQELLHQISTYEILLYSDKSLRYELKLVLKRPKIKSKLGDNIPLYLKFFDLTTKYLSNIKPMEWNTPDSKDNFLFDLCVAADNASLVTGDKRLINFYESPVEIISWRTFNDRFPTIV